MKGIFFAHSLEGRDQRDWEKLTDHLLDTASRAAQFAAAFGYEEFGHAVGLLHDLGKYQTAFQARLQGGAKVDHAAHGACYARRQLHPLGDLIAHGIAGHHAGLKDDLFETEGRLVRMAATLDPVIAAAKADGLVLPMRLLPKPLTQSGPVGFQLAFLTRMLFSCLVDADYLATAEFYCRAEQRPVPARGGVATLSQLATALDRHLKQRFTTPQSGSLNARRSEILAYARSHAKKPLGVFTLTVPTGGGKTLTSLAFALDHARQHNLDRVIVGIPFNSVIEQTAAIYRTALVPHEEAILEHHSAFDQSRIDGKEARDKLSLAMENWDYPLIVTTTVRLFESLFSNRPGQCRKLHNLARSVIVLDEVQTLPLGLLRPCVAALKELAANYGCSIVLCTATQPALLAAPPGGLRPFTDGFDNVVELAPDPPALFEALRRVRVVRIDTPQTDDDIAGRLAAAPQALCIVNRRAHAQALYQAVRHLEGAHHLSTLMCAAHRREILTQIRSDLADGRPCRVISTSLIEAGVDVDFPLVLRAEAGLDSILQAAGRCNREGGRDVDSSHTLVFEPADGKRLQSMRAHIETSESVFRRFPDVTGLDAVAAYFDELLCRKGDADLDVKAILRACQDQIKTLDFPFATIAKDFQMIDDYTDPVIVLWDEAARAAVRELRFLPDGISLGGIARRLQRYTVGVPPRARCKLIDSGAAAVIDEVRFGDQFVLLVNPDLYHADMGLTWEDPTLMEAERLVL